MKVKNIMFFGFAAAILSATGAQAAATATFSPAVSAPDAAGRQIVSSKSYVDSVATNIAGQLKSVAVTGDYNDLDNKPTVDTTYDSESSNAQSGTAVAGAITSALEGVATDLSGKQDNLGGTGQGGKVVTATETAGEVTYTQLAPVATSGAYSDLTGTPTVDQTYDGTSANAQSGTAVAGAITSALEGVATDLSGKQDNLGGTGQGGKVVTATETAGEVTYTQLAPVATSGQYSDLAGTPTVDTTFSASSNNAATSAAIATYVGNQIASANTYDSALSETSENAVQNKVVTTELNKKANSDDLATVATSGQYSDLAGTPTVDTTFSASSNNAATSAAIATYINNQNFTTVDSVIPAKPSFCTDTNPCALLQDANGYNWYTMATDQSAARQAGTDEKPNPRS